MIPHHGISASPRTRRRLHRWSLLATTIAVLACAGSRAEPPPAAPEPATLAPEPPPRPAARSVVATAGRSAASACTAQPVGDADDYWQFPRDSLPALDRKVRQAVDSVFAVLRAHERFRRLRNADAYHRQYLGIWFDGQPLVYVHGVLANSVRGRRDAPTVREMGRRLVTLCDGGTSVFGLLYNPATGTLGRLKFGNGDETDFDYEEIIPPQPDQVSARPAAGQWAYAVATAERAITPAADTPPYPPAQMPSHAPT